MKTLNDVIPELFGDKEFKSDKVGEYEKVRGIFLLPKNAFIGTDYNPKKGFTISFEALEELGIKPEELLQAQCRNYANLTAEALANPDRDVNTMKRHVNIGLQSLVDAGMSLEDAKALIAVALQDLYDQGVREPSCIPCQHAK
ncbi:MAG: hypothetical protein IJM54_05135 [Thermoguttaceae bacterium]|nr:hypothetical protein [Thermoguttaceae bacterium]